MATTEAVRTPDHLLQQNFALQLALACQSLREVEEEKAEASEEFKRRIAVIKGEIKRLSNDILTGQGQLPLEK